MAAAAAVPIGIEEEMRTDGVGTAGATGGDRTSNKYK